MGMVVYRDNNDNRKDSWIRYLLRRIKKNKNNLIVIVGKTGSGKTWSAMSICEKISKENGVSFDERNIVFNLRELMDFINSPRAVKGACLIFDEPQITISSKDFMSQANKVFNYLLTTFRHRNLNLFFCTPYEDLLDKTSRKLFHCKFETMSINHNKKTTKIKAKIMDYNSQRSKFYEKFLRVCFKKEGKAKFSTTKLKYWDINKPSKPLIRKYEEKKLAFTTSLNLDIRARLDAYELKNKPKIKEPTENEVVVLKLESEGFNQDAIAERLNISQSAVSCRKTRANRRGWSANDFKIKEINEIVA